VLFFTFSSRVSIVDLLVTEFHPRLRRVYPEVSVLSCLVRQTNSVAIITPASGQADFLGKDSIIRAAHPPTRFPHTRNGPSSLTTNHTSTTAHHPPPSTASQNHPPTSLPGTTSTSSSATGRRINRSTGKPSSTFAERFFSTSDVPLIPTKSTHDPRARPIRLFCTTKSTINERYERSRESRLRRLQLSLSLQSFPVRTYDVRRRRATDNTRSSAEARV
jgi:hypothetical protein